MNNKNPLVSAIIPTKNRAPLLRRALESVAAQSYGPVEIVVVDDGSSDNTPQVVEAFGKSHTVQYLRNERSEGAPRARNRGVKAAKGSFVAGLDDDDEWHPERIALFMEAYNDSCACITSDVTIQYDRTSAVWHKADLITLDDLLLSNQVGNQVLVKRDRFLEVAGFDEALEAAQDYDLWIRLCEAYGPIKNVKKPLQIIHLEHGEKRISNSISQLRGYLAFYKKHKHRMNAMQRKYQLYNIRRSQGKHPRLRDIVGWVPPARYFKETKRWITDRFFSY